MVWYEKYSTTGVRRDPLLLKEKWPGLVRMVGDAKYKEVEKLAPMLFLSFLSKCGINYSSSTFPLFRVLRLVGR